MEQISKHTRILRLLHWNIYNLPTYILYATDNPLCLVVHVLKCCSSLLLSVNISKFCIPVDWISVSAFEIASYSIDNKQKFFSIVIGSL